MKACTGKKIDSCVSSLTSAVVCRWGSIDVHGHFERIELLFAMQVRHGTLHTISHVVSILCVLGMHSVGGQCFATFGASKIFAGSRATPFHAFNM